MLRFKLTDYKKSQRGDTIVEVLISVAILALALAISYSLANRSLRTGLSANARAEATAIAQGQVEMLKSARYTNPATFDSTFRITAPFCITQDNPLSASSSSSCTNIGNGYSSEIRYNDTTQVYSVTVSWDTFNAGRAGGRDTLTVNYRLPR